MKKLTHEITNKTRKRQMDLIKEKQNEKKIKQQQQKIKIKHARKLEKTI